MKALVLSGGGALGAFEAGAIQALSDSHDESDIVCGTSIGAINAAFTAQDKIPQLTSLWQRIGTLDPPVIDYIEQVQFAIDLADEFEKITHLNPFGVEPFLKRWAQLGSKKAFLALRGFLKPNAVITVEAAEEAAAATMVAVVADRAVRAILAATIMALARVAAAARPTLSLVQRTCICGTGGNSRRLTASSSLVGSAE